MKLLAKNLKQNFVKLLLENQDDVWYLSQIVDPGDVVKGMTVRKVKTSEEAEASKKKVFLEIEVERSEFTPDALRLSGKVAEGTEDVSSGSYHTFSASPGTSLTIVKKKWYAYQLDRIDEAVSARKTNLLICVFDREDAYFALVKNSGIEHLSHMQGDVVRKRMKTGAKGNFFEEVASKLSEYDSRYSLDVIVVASPAFWKDELFKVLKDEKLRKKMVPASCSSVGERAVSEVLKRDEVRQALRQERTANELSLVEDILAEISRQGAVAYGLKNVKFAAEAGAVKVLAVSDSLIKKAKEEGSFESIDDVLRSVDSQQGKIVIVSSLHEGGKKLDGIGGIAALLRYKLSYD